MFAEKTEHMENAPTAGRYARILLDDWFKRAFGSESRKRLMVLFLQELLPERKITQLTYVTTEHVNPHPDDKSIRVDVECTDADGSRFVVEMQLAKQAWFYERALFNSSFAIQQQIQSGEANYRFPPVYFIGILDFALHPGSDRIFFRYELREEQTGEKMTDRIQYIFLELPNCSRAMTDKATVLENFCYALHNMERFPEKPAELTQEIFTLLFDSAEIAKFTPQEKTKYEFDMTTERDRINQMEYALEEARKNSLAEGRAEGLAEGLAEGIAQAKADNARKMLEKGMDKALIADITGLSHEEIDALAQQ